MHLLGARLPQHVHELLAGGAAHDRIVDDDDALAFQQAVDGVELDLDAEVTDGLLRLT